MGQPTSALPSTSATGEATDEMIEALAADEIDRLLETAAAASSNKSALPARSAAARAVATATERGAGGPMIDAALAASMDSLFNAIATQSADPLAAFSAPPQTPPLAQDSESPADDAARPATLIDPANPEETDAAMMAELQALNEAAKAKNASDTTADAQDAIADAVTEPASRKAESPPGDEALAATPLSTDASTNPDDAAADDAVADDAAADDAVADDAVADDAAAIADAANSSNSPRSQTHEHTQPEAERTEIAIPATGQPQAAKPLDSAAQEQKPAPDDPGVMNSKSQAPRSGWLGFVVRILEWVNEPSQACPDEFRDAVGKIGLVTIFNAVAVLIYVMVFRRK